MKDARIAAFLIVGWAAGLAVFASQLERGPKSVRRARQAYRRVQRARFVKERWGRRAYATT